MKTKYSFLIILIATSTSGLESYWDEHGDDEKGDDLKYIYSLIKNDELVGTVGRYNYSNSG